MKTQCQQDWYKRNSPVEQQKFYEGVIMNSALLKWALRCEYITTDIPDLMRTHMYSASYGNPLMARQTLSGIQTGRELDACRECTECTSRCSLRVPIADRIRELKEVYC